MAIELTSPHNQQLAEAPDETSVSTGLEPRTMKALWWLCKELVGTGFLPDAIKQPGQAVAIILAGKELGMGTMESLRSINIIKGRITLAADAQLGLMLKAGIRIEWLECSEKRAAMKLARNGAEMVFSFTIEEANCAGLSGDNWKKYAPAMLRARCISGAAKAFAPDVLHGAYDPEELAPQAPAPVASAAVHEKQTRTASIKERLKAEAVSDAPPAPPADEKENA